MRFRCTIAGDFLREMRDYARTINPHALITCNNSLNSPDALFSQCRTYGYSIDAMSRVEDLVVVEDMVSQPRVLPDGRCVEYGPVYEMLHAISHGKPIIAVTLADGDYHTPPNLMRLAMAEAAAHEASYLSWPTWPAEHRQPMIDAVRPAADFLREHADLLNGTSACADVNVFLPFRRWLQTTDCTALKTAAALTRENLQFQVISEENLAAALADNPPPALIVESPSALSTAETATIENYQAHGGRVIWSERENWLNELKKSAASRAVVLEAPPTVRAVVRQKANKTIVHLLNLNVQKLSSFEDRVTPASGARVEIRCRNHAPSSVVALSPDADATHGPLQFTATRDKDITTVTATVPRLCVSSILVIE